jgi:hypothetical protein
VAEAGALTEAAAIPWRRRADEDALRSDGRRWTLWTVGVVLTFGAPAAAVIALEPLTAPVALLLAAHGGAVLHMQAGRGARAVVPMGSERSAANRARSRPGPEGVALGLLGDLLGHDERELLTRTGLALQRGCMGVWLVGEEGALMVRPGGRRVDCWCVRVAEAGDLPAGDRVAHLLLALREDERGFATVANFNFSGAYARVALRTSPRSRPALEAARELARELA